MALIHRGHQRGVAKNLKGNSKKCNQGGEFFTYLCRLFEKDYMY
jgi:hypothetical protein